MIKWVAWRGKNEITSSNRLQIGPTPLSSQFSSGEIVSIIVAWLVLSVAITYQALVGILLGTGNVDVVAAGFIATATGFILHEMGHKLIAIRRGYLAHFRLWIWGLVLTLAVVTLSGGLFLFGAPGAVYIAPVAAQFSGYNHGQRTRDQEADSMIISAAGPGINLAFAIGFLIMGLQVPPGFLSTVATFGLYLNVGLGSFNMLPVSLLDGAKIFKKSIPVGLGLAVPLWTMFIIFFILLGR